MKVRSQTWRARARLRAWLVVFCLALSVPGGLLVYTAYDQLKWESFRRQQLLAQDLAASVDRTLSELARVESERPAEDYGFLLGSGAGPRSPLSRLPPSVRIPGLMGWFQVGGDGRFSTPWVPGPGVTPSAYGIDAADLASRQADAARIEGVLVGNRLVEGAPAGDRPVAPPAHPADGLAAAPAPQMAVKGEPFAELAETRLSQAAFERLAAPESKRLQEKGRSRALGRVEELKLDSALAARRQSPARDLDVPARKSLPADESEVMGDARADRESGLALDLAGRVGPVSNERPKAWASVPVRLFDAEREPFRLARLGSGHLVMFRRALFGDEQVIQGLLLDQDGFISGLLGEPFAEGSLAESADLTIAHQGDILTTLRARPAGPYRLASRGYDIRASELSGALLYRTRLADPFGALELIFSIRRLPTPPGASAIVATAVALGLVLLVGTWLFWRLGSRQIALAGQQQAFVSAVSHELKTPLTSIRMYAEMLRAGFADAGRRETYYRYIQEESERLSRLIANVLQLSRISRGTLSVDPRPTAIAELMGQVAERIASPAQRAGFEIRVDCREGGWVVADPDAVVQVLINLVDNALKFAAGAEPRLVEIRCARLAPGWWRFSVRDYGPGVPRASRRQVFQLFYRGDEALRQAVPGTGIGLALVEGLTAAMGGRVSLADREPGAEFRVDLRAAEQEDGPQMNPNERE